MKHLGIGAGGQELVPLLDGASVESNLACVPKRYTGQGRSAHRLQISYVAAAGLTRTETVLALPSEAMTNWGALGAETTCPPVTLTW